LRRVATAGACDINWAKIGARGGEAMALAELGERTAKRLKP